MGIVYLAEQTEPIRRKVALKVIKLGMDTKEVLARFESERQALALMNHPNIAKVLEAGATEDGRPYFVMEYVAGVRITRYCDSHRLSIEDRLEVFNQVCSAVLHAHERGIIHRDIKPSNILVEILDGKTLPKLIDFGVAKAIDQKLARQTFFTEYGILLGTPEYMSPEQMTADSSEVDQRSDIYSLGILLYELLVGCLPFDAEELRCAGYHEMSRIIQEEIPPTLGARLRELDNAVWELAYLRGSDLPSLRKKLKGDLESVTATALEKDPVRRYSSVSDLENDLRRYLGKQPISTRPPPSLYRSRDPVRRFTRRRDHPTTGTTTVKPSTS
jgi:non-specific serine/threonine protein kinase/serine/threonine-protein kinase